MRKIFLDVGADTGQSIYRFQEIFGDHAEYEIFCFEPNKKSTEHLNRLGPNITIINKAVWVYDGIVDFFPAGNHPGGSTIFKDKTTCNISSTPIEVPALDLNRWMLEQFTKDDFIVIQMNIEGAEYNVLRKMLDKGSMALINKLYVFWHFRKIPSITKKQHQTLIGDIEAAGHKLLKWRE